VADFSPSLRRQGTLRVKAGAEQGKAEQEHHGRAGDFDRGVDAISSAAVAAKASTETVIAVPSAMANTDSTPPAQSPFRKAKESTISAPEQGRRPTAATADQAVFQLKRSPEIIAGSGACEWPQVAQTSPAAWVCE
jgi:hypothetical protein